MKIVLLSRATGSVSSANLSAVNGSKARENGRRRDRRRTADNIVTNGNEESCP